MVRAAFSICALAAVVGCATTPAAPSSDGGWIETWAAAVTAPTPEGGVFPPSPRFENQTVRQVVRISAGGEQLRVRLSNEYGAAPLRIGAARVALADEHGEVVRGTEHSLTFSGRASAVIPAGAPLVSDPVDMAADDLAALSISLYFPDDTGPCTCHLMGMTTGYISEPGDHTAGVFEPAETFTQRAFLSGVDVTPRGPGATVATLGDSITDGVGSSPDANSRWPDLLAERLSARGEGRVWAVANVGIGANRVLSPGAGDAALARFDRDVLGRPGVAVVIVFEGVNDIGFALGDTGLPPAAAAALGGGGVSADALIAAYTQMIERAHLHGIKIFGATITPYEGATYYSERGEAIRQEVNAWIRTSGRFDGVLDFDAVLADPAHPGRIADGLHAGDFLHGSDSGYRAMADSIDLSLFR